MDLSSPVFADHEEDVSDLARLNGRPVILRRPMPEPWLLYRPDDLDHPAVIPNGHGHPPIYRHNIVSSRRRGGRRRG